MNKFCKPFCHNKRRRRGLFKRQKEKGIKNTHKIPHRTISKYIRSSTIRHSSRQFHRMEISRNFFKSNLLKKQRLLQGHRKMLRILLPSLRNLIAVLILLRIRKYENNNVEYIQYT